MQIRLPKWIPAVWSTSVWPQLCRQAWFIQPTSGPVWTKRAKLAKLLPPTFNTAILPGIFAVHLVPKIDLSKIFWENVHLSMEMSAKRNDPRGASNTPWTPCWLFCRQHTWPLLWGVSRPKTDILGLVGGCFFWVKIGFSNSSEMKQNQRNFWPSKMKPSST